MKVLITVMKFNLEVSHELVVFPSIVRPLLFNIFIKNIGKKVETTLLWDFIYLYMWWGEQDGDDISVVHSWKMRGNGAQMETWEIPFRHKKKTFLLSDVQSLDQVAQRFCWVSIVGNMWRHFYVFWLPMPWSGGAGQGKFLGTL